MLIRPGLLEAVWPGGRANLQPKAMQVLVTLARTDGAVVGRDELHRKCWGERAVSDDAVHRVIRLLRVVESQSGGCGFSIQTVPKVGYRLIEAAAYEGSPPPEDRPTPSGRPLLAVLAFDNLTGEPDLAYLSDGISEEILHTLAKTTGLRLIGRSSSFALKGADTAAPRVGVLLGATHMLAGSVRRAGDRLRITIQLESCTTGSTLWSDRFDVSLSDIFELQDEIAAAVARALDVAFAPSLATGQIDPMAFELYLRARGPGLERLGGNIALLEQAVERSPSFAQAWAQLAYWRAMVMRMGLGSETVERQLILTSRAAQRAMELDPAGALGLLAMATLLPLCGHHGEHRRLVNRALAVSPNDPVVLSHAAGMYDTIGRQRQAFAMIVQAYELDPRSTGWYRGYLLQTLGRSPEADAGFDRDLERWPDTQPLWFVALGCAYERGDWERYDRLLAKLPAEFLDAPNILGLRWSAERERSWSEATASAVLGELRQLVGDTGTTRLSLAGLLCERGHVDAVYETLETASFDSLFTPEGVLPFGELGLNALFKPRFAALRRDRQFVTLCARLGLCAFWAESGEWPDCVAEVTPHYDLKVETARVLATGRSTASARPVTPGSASPPSVNATA